jgi:hypothetical protein
MPLVFIGATWGQIIHTTVASIIEMAILAFVIFLLLLKTLIEAYKEYKLHKCDMETKRKTIVASEIDNYIQNPLTTDSNSNKNDDSRSKYAINLGESMERDFEEVKLEMATHDEEMEGDPEYKPRYIKRLIPLLVMFILLGKFSPSLA